MKKKLVLIGNGMAGVRCVENILKLAPDLYDITIFGSEPHPNYNRIMLSGVLAGDADMRDIILNDWDWYRQNRIAVYPGQTVTALDIAQKRVRTDKGVCAHYDELILATGSLPFMLPLPGANKEGVIAFRDMRDCETMMAAARKYRKAVVIGGGLLGLEAARGLLNLSMEVAVVHIYRHLMERQLDRTAAVMLQKELESQGMTFLLEKQTEAILGKERVRAVRFKDGGEESADLVVMAVGIRPNVALAKAHGIKVDRGIAVNDYMETSEPHIYAVGECAEHRGIAYGLVAPLYEQGGVLAKRLCGVPSEGYAGSATATKLKVSGVDVFSAGRYNDDATVQTLIWQDDFAGVYKKLAVKDGKLVGAVLFGDTADSARLFQRIRSGESVAGRERELILPGGAETAGKSGLERVAAMPPDEQVCGCNGVSKGDIVQAIRQWGLRSVEEVKFHTKASGGCGNCKGAVADILRLVLGDGAATQEKSGICPCTSHSRDDIVEAIRSMRLTTSKEVRHVMNWNHPDGCSKCRPALNYYLGMVWPAEHAEERESRFVNERNHANIQKDGTYSVVPRMYGGVVSPGELVRIAAVAEKYRVPLVKVTGGQRLDLLGVKKEDLPAIWSELDMPSGYAYGKALRTVKTCVGSTFCRFGTQDSIKMGIDLEKRFERLNTPAKVKMAVSGCPRNCAESLIKDLGVVAVEAGWEMYVGGNGGAKVRVADLLCKVETDREVIEYAGAYLQHYRETAHYNERTSAWVERIGLDAIRRELSSPERRSRLLERIDETLSLSTDPWKEIRNSEELLKQFGPPVAIDSLK